MKRGKLRRLSRRGVVSVLAMMFLVLFGSLAGAMAVASRGNLRTASAHLHVIRAQGAAETGLAIAQQRLRDAAARFVVERSNINETLGLRLWGGTYSSSDGLVTVLPATDGRAELGLPGSIARALANIHAADQSIVEVDGVTVPVISPAPAGADTTSTYQPGDWVITPAVAITPTRAGDTVTPAAFQVTYAPLRSADGRSLDIRIIVTGYDFDYSNNDRPLTRVITQDFRIAKRVDAAVVAPTRVMLGKNVLVTGDVGIGYTDVAANNGNPLVMKSDFLNLDPVLDAKLNDFFAAVRQYDVDGDHRLRTRHPTEGSGLPPGSRDYDNDGEGDNAFADVTGDGFVDEFDIFIKHFDADNDGRIVLSAALTQGTPAQGRTPELVDSNGRALDDRLSELIDSSRPDRNRNGIFGFEDDNNNGRWDSGEAFLDVDPVNSANRDQVLGFRDGFIDRRDQYAKVGGRLIYRVAESDWRTAQPNYKDFLQGPIRPAAGKPPLTFNASNSQLPVLTAESFTNTQTALRNAADQDFWEQVATQLGVSVNQLASWSRDSTGPRGERFWRLAPDADGDGNPDNASTAYFEKMPFNSPGFSDWYFRPVFENFTFKNVVIPQGVNALFKNCVFVGVTRVRTHTDNTHPFWAEYGRMLFDNSIGRPRPEIARTEYTGTSFPPVLPASALPPSQRLWLSPNNAPYDKGDVTQDRIAGIANYAQIADPLIIDGRRVIDTRWHSNNIRFHDCLIVGSVLGDNATRFNNVRNKLQFTGATRFTTKHPEFPDDAALNPDGEDLPEIQKSSLMMPNFSVDIGQFNSPNSQNVRLQGAIVAGVLDVRGNASIDGALLLTFSPDRDQYPFRDRFGNPINNPADFNTTLGYFGPEDGDAESLDPNRLPFESIDGVMTRVIGWDLPPYDDIPELGPSSPPTQAQRDAGARAVPFYGFGGIDLRFNPEMTLPDGIMLPLQVRELTSTYREGRK